LSISRYSEEDNISVTGHWSCDWGSLFLMDPTEYVSPTPSPEDENRSSFTNVVFFRIPYNIQNPGNPGFYKPLSEPFTIYFILWLLLYWLLLPYNMIRHAYCLLLCLRWLLGVLQLGFMH
jgi:hypothetical protein